MGKTIIIALCSVLALPTMGCNAPRGAAVTSEILGGAADPAATFAVVSVSKTNLHQIADWPGLPAPGYRWLKGGRGAAGTVLRGGDTVDLTIWDSSENSLLVPPGAKQVAMPGLTVSPKGTIFIPYVGEVVVSGASVDRAREEVQARVAEVSPAAQVVLSAQAGSQNAVDLVSGMQRPGTYPMPDRDLSVLSMLAQGGGIAPGLRNPIIRLIRDGQTYQISASRLLENGSLDAAMRGGDKLLVEEDDRYFTALGATGSEKLIYFEKDRITALEAMSIVGGLSDTRADPKGVLILRNYAASAVRPDGKGPPKTDVVFTFDLTQGDALFAARAFSVMPGDTVLVTESPLPAAQSVLVSLATLLGLSKF